MGRKGATGPKLDDGAVLRARFASLLLTSAGSEGRSAEETVAWFGALQGQDLGSVLWSIGARTGQSRAELEGELEAGRLVRTWPMRGTLHLVPGQDAAWMVRHLGAAALLGAAQRRAYLGIEDADAHRAVDVLGEALAGSGGLTRSEAVATLQEAGIDASGQRGYHLLWFVAQNGLTCIGPQRGKEQTFHLLSELAPAGPDLDREEALATLAGRFVRAHGPVSAHDLARWAGLSVTEARAALAAVEGLVDVEHDGRALLVTAEALAAATSATTDLPSRALPGFDEFVLGYRDRTAQLDREHEKIVVPGGNGVFSNTLVHEGRVVGTWKRRVLTRSVAITATPFRALTGAATDQLNAALDRFGDHLGLTPKVEWASTAT